MPYNLLLLPLLGGYIFALNFNLTGYYVMRADKERLLIVSSISGLFSIIIVFCTYSLASAIVPCSNYSFCVDSIWSKYVPFEYSGIALASFLLCLVGWYPLNWIPNLKDWVIDRIIDRDADPLELLVRNTQRNNLLVAVTLTGGKYYIGFVTHQLNPGTPTNYLGIAPIQSGYRDNSRKTVEITNDYSGPHREIKHAIRKEQVEWSAICNENADYLYIVNCELQLNPKNKFVRWITKFGLTRWVLDTCVFARKNGQDFEEIDLTSLRTVVKIISETTTLSDELRSRINHWNQLIKKTELISLTLPVSEILSVSAYDLEFNGKYLRDESDVNKKNPRTVGFENRTQF